VHRTPFLGHPVYGVYLLQKQPLTPWTLFEKKKHSLTRRSPPKSSLSPPIYALPTVLPTPPLVLSLSGSTFVFGMLLWRYRKFKFKF
jgi:hypothetical protein